MPTPQFAVWIVGAQDYAHNACFDDVARTLQEAFSELGYPQVDIVRGLAPPPAEHPIVLAGHLLPHYGLSAPPGAVIYNFEQVGSPWISPSYLRVLHDAWGVWEYSAQNMKALRELGVHAELLEVGYSPQRTRFAAVGAKSIDVLHVGSLNPRRERVLDTLRSANVAVHQAFGVYGEELDRLVAASKILLNIHYYDAHILEIVRIAHGLSNFACVVSEASRDFALEHQLQGGVAFAEYEDLAALCLGLLADPPTRWLYATTGFDLFRERRQAPLLKRALTCFDDRRS